MSAEEDTELRDLVAQTLEANGVLGKIRAQLRASVFLALEEQEHIQNKTPFLNKDLQKFLSTSEGIQVVLLIKEFLQFFKLEYTLAVFEPEVSCPTEKLEFNRSVLAKQLDLVDAPDRDRIPLLASVLRQYKDADVDSVRRPSLLEILPKHIVEEARRHFSEYDMDKSGQIDKNELRQLFCDLFPNFHRNMIERYVNDEFRSADKDFSSQIDFEEFLALYQRIFILSKSSATAEQAAHNSHNSPLSLVDSKLQTKPVERNGVTAVKSAGVQDIPSSKQANSSLFSARKNSSGSDVDTDPFFDDQFFEKKNKLPLDKVETTNPPASSGNKSANSLTSLADLPALSANGRAPAATVASIGKKEDKKDESELIDLDDDDRYDDDFQGSNISPIGQTPRSARSDKNIISIENDDEIEEEIEEEFSNVDDLLKSDRSVNDEVTTDRTVSPAEQSAAGDYIEDIQLP